MRKTYKMINKAALLLTTLFVETTFSMNDYPSSDTPNQNYSNLNMRHVNRQTYRYSTSAPAFIPMTNHYQQPHMINHYQQPHMINHYQQPQLPHVMQQGPSSRNEQQDERNIRAIKDSAAQFDKLKNLFITKNAYELSRVARIKFYKKLLYRINVNNIFVCIMSEKNAFDLLDFLLNYLHNNKFPLPSFGSWNHCVEKIVEKNIEKKGLYLEFAKKYLVPEEVKRLYSCFTYHEEKKEKTIIATARQIQINNASPTDSSISSLSSQTYGRTRSNSTLQTNENSEDDFSYIEEITNPYNLHTAVNDDECIDEILSNSTLQSKLAEDEDDFSYIKEITNPSFYIQITI